MRFVEAKPMKLLPPPDGCCRICAVKHEPNEFHDARSLFYQTRFQMRYKRNGTWADAVAHLPPHVQATVRAVVEANGIPWTEPPVGVEPIAERIDG